MARVPPRPGIVVRIPDREKAKDGENDNFSLDRNSRESQPQPVLLQQPTINSAQFCFTLYTNIKKCKHSVDILEKIEKYGLVCDNIDVTRSTNNIKWVTGTPIIEFEGSGYCGDLAFEFIDSLHDYIKSASMKPIGKSENSTSKPETIDPVDSSGKTGTIFDRLNKDSDDTHSFSKAFSSPSEIQEDDSRYNMSSEDMMKNVSSLLRR